MLPDLYFRITAAGNTAAAFSKTKAEVNSLKAQMIGLGVASRAAIGSIAGFTAVGGLYLLGRSIRGAVRDAGDLVDAANKIGISAEKLQELRFAAEQSGETVENLDSLMAMFTKRLGDAAQGSGELYDLLRLNGVALRDQSGEMRSVSAILGDVADLIAHAASAQDRMNVATAAFGKAGGGAVNIFGRGAQGIRDFASEAREAGLVIDEQMLRKAAEIDDAWQKLTARIGTAWHRMILAAAGETEYLVDLLQSQDERSTETLQRQLATMQAAKKGVLGSVLAPLSGTYIANLDNEMAPIMAELQKRAQLQLRGQLLGMQKPGNPFDPTAIPPSGGGATTKATDLGDSVRMVTDEIEAMDDSLRDSLETGRAFAETFISGMMSGKSAVESLKDALGGLADKLLNSGLDAIFGTGKAGGGLFSFLGGLGGGAAVPGSIGLYADGGYIRPGHYGIVGEAGPELVRAGRGGMTVTPSGGGRSISVVTNIDARGAGPGVSGELRAALDARDARLRRELPSLVAQAGGDPRRR